MPSVQFDADVHFAATGLGRQIVCGHILCSLERFWEGGGRRWTVSSTRIGSCESP